MRWQNLMDSHLNEGCTAPVCADGFSAPALRTARSRRLPLSHVRTRNRYAKFLQ